MHIQMQMRFTLLQCKGEIGHQHMSISDLIQPTQPMNHEIAQRPDQHTGNSMPYSNRARSTAGWLVGLASADYRDLSFCDRGLSNTGLEIFPIL